MSSLSTASPQRLQALKIWPRKELKEVVHRLNYFEKTGLDHRKGRPEERPPFQGLEKSRYRALRYIGTETTLFTKRHGDRFTNHFSLEPDFFIFSEAMASILSRLRVSLLTVGRATIFCAG